MDDLKERRRAYYNSKSKEELVEMFIKRDENNEKSSVVEMVKESNKDLLVQCCRKNMLDLIEDKDIMEKILVNRYSNGDIHPTTYFERLLNSALTPEFKEEFGKKLSEFLKNNYERICERIIFRSFVKSLTDESCFRGGVQDIVDKYLD